MIPELEAHLRRMTLAQVQAYRRLRVRQGENTVISRWHGAKAMAEQYPDWPQMQQEWADAQATRAQYEAGLAEIDAIIADIAEMEGGK